MNKTAELLELTRAAAVRYLESLPTRAVGRPVDYAALLAAMGGALPEEGADAEVVLDHLCRAADAGLVATAGPRYFGFVIGGALPAALAADWMTSAWDQNGFSYATSPAAAVAEEVAKNWLIEALGLPSGMSCGFATGGTMANFTGLAAGRHALYRKLGWDVEELGLLGAPEITVVASEESHVSIFASLQMLGLGRGRAVKIAADGQGRVRSDELRRVLAGIATPVLVCAQAGNVNTGSFDPLREIAECVHERGGWLHVDGAFGGWAACAAQLRGLTEGLAEADSFAVDAHKWLNVPYDCGLVFVRDAAAHEAAMTLYASYYAGKPAEARENHNWVAEASRRARGFTVYAALRSLGRQGLSAMMERCCGLAGRMAAALARAEGVEILNDVVLNQVLVRFGDDGFTDEVVRRVQREGT